MELLPPIHRRHIPVLLCLLLHPPLAMADPATAVLPGPKTAPADARPDPHRLEFGVTPVLAGDSDIGLAFGGMFTLARFGEGYYPYRWRVEVLLMASVKEGDDGLELPFHNDYIKLDLPGLLDDRLRLNFKLAFGRLSNSGYYGMGNASAVREGKGARYHQYDRIYPGLEARARIKLSRRVSLMLGGSLTYNWITPYDNSLLQEETHSSDPQVGELLHGTDDHAVVQLDAGVVYDSRDHEFAPTRGMFHEVSGRLSPGPAGGTDLTYGGVNVTARFFHPLYGDRLVLAARVMVDLLWGRPPLYELARHGGLFPDAAVGGSCAVRGVPLHRYHGKIKLLGNLELRSKLLPFSLFGQRFNLGTTVFADTGRVVADWQSAPSQDGSGLGLKLGLGGGIRFQWGETFLLRADVAWSPDADPVGVYVDINHVF